MLNELQRRATAIDDQHLITSAQEAADMVSAPELSVKHKLKVTIPIVPLLLGYEGEVELNSRLNLEASWQALQRLVFRRRLPT